MDESRDFKITLTLPLKDWQSFLRMACKCDRKPEEILTSFVGDLVDGKFTNGSDERVAARQWYERVYFWTESFLAYICDDIEMLEQMVDIKNGISSSGERIKKLRGYLESGTYDVRNICNHMERRSWQDLEYESIEKFNDEILEDIREEEAEIEQNQEELEEVLDYFKEEWNEFQRYCPYHTSTYEEEMEKAEKWIRSYMAVSDEQADKEDEYKEVKAMMNQLAARVFEKHKKDVGKWLHGEIKKAWFDHDNICIEYQDGTYWHYNWKGEWWQ